MSKYKDIEEILSYKTDSFDKKKKLNRCSKAVPQTILDQIENGITIEQLEAITKDLPVYKYGTQITIHGLFSELSTNRLFGYKSIFQNKNKSIGVKWNCIDEQKRRELKEPLSFLGFRYTRSSNNCTFERIAAVNEDNFADKYKSFRYIADNIDKSLFFGGVSFYAGSLWGQKYLVLELNISAIYSKNIPLLLKPFIDKIEKNKVAYELRRDEELKELQKEKKQKKEKIKELLAIKDPEIKELKTHTFIKETNKPGVYIRLEICDYNPRVGFKAIKIHKKKGREKLNRVNYQFFDTLKEALLFNPEVNYKSTKLRYTKNNLYIA